MKATKGKSITVPTALTIAGSDPSGGAGLQADLKTFSQFEVYGMTAITCLTVGNTQGVTEVKPMEAEFLQSQAKSIMEDIEPLAIKTGMLFNNEIILATIEILKTVTCPVVIDPVMTTKRGDKLLTEECVEQYIKGLIPIADMVTPNLPEAEMLTGYSITNKKDMEIAAERILRMGCRSVIIKGGHFRKENHSDDLFFDGTTMSWLKSKRHQTKHTHGTGDVLSAAITALLARGFTLYKSAEVAKKFISQAIETSPNLGKGNGPINFNTKPELPEC